MHKLINITTTLDLFYAVMKVINATSHLSNIALHCNKIICNMIILTTLPACVIPVLWLTVCNDAVTCVVEMSI